MGKHTNTYDATGEKLAARLGIAPETLNDLARAGLVPAMWLPDEEGEAPLTAETPGAYLFDSRATLRMFGI